ncbi:hypothetical protein O181_097394 [Austropuccinia psidii MF-1]|uniref:Uncharacterized protein n=1 Tax=Austropuccinia psidii MF-1 TaxID=1389203 RepID=A0A9Q3J970_9BASI|nr:hypothetical protein [Austropuccinia psidii MF-1]
MSSKLTALTESSPYSHSGSGILSQFPSPWSMASSGHFDPAQTYDGSKASLKYHFFSVGKRPCPRTGPSASSVRGHSWSKKDGIFGKVSEAPTPDGTSGYSNLTGSRKRDVARWTNVGRPIRDEVVKRIRQIVNSPPDPDAEGSDELDVEEAEVVHKSSTSPSHPPAKIFQSHIIPSTP